jgi:hypothetical protein
LPVTLRDRGGSAELEALHGLTGDTSDDLEARVQMQDRQPGEIGSRSEDQSRDGRRAVLARSMAYDERITPNGTRRSIPNPCEGLSTIVGDYHR